MFLPIGKFQSSGPFESTVVEPKSPGKGDSVGVALLPLSSEMRAAPTCVACLCLQQVLWQASRHWHGPQR